MLKFIIFIGFEGYNCEKNIDDCTGNLCQHGSTCIDGVNTYSCQCPANWEGRYCNQDVDECSRNNPCQNHGTCQNNEGGYECICVNGFIGDNCETDEDDCLDEPCMNGGTCVDRVGGYFCRCPPGKTGLLCHLDDACASNPCNIGARCDTNPVDGGYTCSCPPGFNGTDCSEDINECAEGSPCDHGGTCVNTRGSFKCQCRRVSIFCKYNSFTPLPSLYKQATI